MNNNNFKIDDFDHSQSDFFQDPVLLASTHEKIYDSTTILKDSIEKEEEKESDFTDTDIEESQIQKKLQNWQYLGTENRDDQLQENYKNKQKQTNDIIYSLIENDNSCFKKDYLEKEKKINIFNCLPSLKELQDKNLQTPKWDEFRSNLINITQSPLSKETIEKVFFRLIDENRLETACKDLKILPYASFNSLQTFLNLNFLVLNHNLSNEEYLIHAASVLDALTKTDQGDMIIDQVSFLCSLKDFITGKFQNQVVNQPYKNFTRFPQNIFVLKPIYDQNILPTIFYITTSKAGRYDSVTQSVLPLTSEEKKNKTAANEIARALIATNSKDNIIFGKKFSDNSFGQILWRMQTQNLKHSLNDQMFNNTYKELIKNDKYNVFTVDFNKKIEENRKPDNLKNKDYKNIQITNFCGTSEERISAFVPDLDIEPKNILMKNRVMSNNGGFLSLSQDERAENKFISIPLLFKRKFPSFYNGIQLMEEKINFIINTPIITSRALLEYKFDLKKAQSIIDPNSDQTWWSKNINLEKISNNIQLDYTFPLTQTKKENTNCSRIFSLSLQNRIENLQAFSKTVFLILREFNEWWLESDENLETEEILEELWEKVKQVCDKNDDEIINIDESNEEKIISSILFFILRLWLNKLNILLKNSNQLNINENFFSDTLTNNILKQIMESLDHTKKYNKEKDYIRNLENFLTSETYDQIQTMAENIYKKENIFKIFKIIFSSNKNKEVWSDIFDTCINQLNYIKYMKIKVDLVLGERDFKGVFSDIESQWFNKSFTQRDRHLAFALEPTITSKLTQVKDVTEKLFMYSYLLTDIREYTNFIKTNLQNKENIEIITEFEKILDKLEDKIWVDMIENNIAFKKNDDGSLNNSEIFENLDRNKILISDSEISLQLLLKTNHSLDKKKIKDMDKNFQVEFSTSNLFNQCLLEWLEKNSDKEKLKSNFLQSLFMLLLEGVKQNNIKNYNGVFDIIPIQICQPNRYIMFSNDLKIVKFATEGLDMLAYYYYKLENENERIKFANLYFDYTILDSCIKNVWNRARKDWVMFHPSIFKEEKKEVQTQVDEIKENIPTEETVKELPTSTEMVPAQPQTLTTSEDSTRESKEVDHVVEKQADELTEEHPLEKLVGEEEKWEEKQPKDLDQSNTVQYNEKEIYDEKMLKEMLKSLKEQGKEKKKEDTTENESYELTSVNDKEKLKESSSWIKDEYLYFLIFASYLVSAFQIYRTLSR